MHKTTEYWKNASGVLEIPGIFCNKTVGTLPVVEGHTKNRPHNDRTPWTTEEPDSGRLITTAHARLSAINGRRSLTIINGLHVAIRQHSTTTHTWNYGAGVVFLFEARPHSVVD